MKRLLLPLLLSGLFAATIHAQSPVLQLRTGAVGTTAVVPADARQLFQDQPDVVDGRLVRCLLFDHTLTGAERAELLASGVHLLAPLRPHAWVVSIAADMDATIFLAHGLVAVHAFGANDKLDPRLRDVIVQGTTNRTDVVVVPWKDARARFAQLVDGMVRGAKAHGTEGARSVSVTAIEAQLLLAHPAVQWIEPLPEAGKPEDLRGRAYHRVNRLGPALPNGTGLDGTGVAVVVNDDGFVGPHVDFKGRTEQTMVADDLLGDHGDMVAGIVGAAGNIDPRSTGMAPACDLVILQYESELPNTVLVYESIGAVIFNSSYSNGCNAGYTAIAQQIDQEVVDHPAILQVFSAGNEGGNDCGYGAGTEWGNISGGHKIAKNVIATANLTDVDGLVASSSRGPSADGRIKPDISAFGNGQMSNASSNGYMTGSGTSAAAPGIAGVTALLYQGWRNLHGGDPQSALVKAILLNTADDLGNTGPDYKYGWGGVNGERAWRTMLEDRWTTVMVDAGEVANVSIDVPGNLAGLRVMAYWMDPAGELMAVNALVNDIDLVGIDNGGGTHLPWSLSIDPDPAALGAPATLGADHLNNVEQVMVVDPSPGTWTFQVHGFDIPLGPQEVFIVYEFLPRMIDITWPNNGEHLASDATHRLRWDTPDRNTPVTLSYSINGGVSWNSYTLNAGQRHFDLGIGDTVLADLRIRVEQGAWTDERTGITTMRTPTGLEVVVNCVDSALLQWPAVLNASAYIVHRLGDRYMQALDTITGTSFWYTGLGVPHDDWFAVTAVGPDGIVGERSIAVARPQQLIGCQAQQDLVVQEVLSPVGPVVLCQPQQPLTFVVHNAGLATVNSFTAGVITADNTTFSTVVNQSIAPGDDLTVELPDAQLGLLPGTITTIKVWATSAVESFGNNDSLAYGFYVHDIVTQFPYTQNMEALANCTQPSLCDEVCPLGQGLVNGITSVEDSLDWRIDSAGTNTANTGPDVDHTYGSAQGHYLYMESTGSCSAGDAHLLLPCFTVPAGAVQLTYSYHMLGSAMGLLHVDLLVDGTWILDAIAPIIGDQGNTWLPGSVDLSPYEGQVVNVRFRGVRGASHISDMALDDIRIGGPVGIEETSDHQGIIVRNGDHAGSYLLGLPGNGQGELVVHDAQGRIVMQRMAMPGAAVPLDLAGCSQGVYTLAWHCGELRATVRVPRF